MAAAKIRFTFEGVAAPWPMDVVSPHTEHDVAQVANMHQVIGRLLVIDCIDERQYRDKRWHDAMAAEGLPTEFDLRPSDAALRNTSHVFYRP